MIKTHRWRVLYFIMNLMQCWGSEKSEGIPKHKSIEQVQKSREEREETNNLRKPALTSKVVNTFTRALTPPFRGIRRDFYISKIPLNLGNIPSANMYMNVFYIPWFAGLISYIYKPATSSHIKTRTFEVTSMAWLLLDSRILYACFTHQNPRISQIPDCIVSQVCDSRASQVRDSGVSRVPQILKRVQSSSIEA
jgi:hypothetical protein